MSYPVRGGPRRVQRAIQDDEAELEIGGDRMNRPTFDEEAPRRETPAAGPDHARMEEFPEDLWSLIPLEQVREAEPGEEGEEDGRRYLVLSRGHADLYPVLQRLLAGLAGIEIVVDRRAPAPSAEVTAQRAEPVLASPPGPAVIPGDEAVEIPEVEVKEAEEAPPPPVQRYIIVSRAHADLAEILRRFQVAYHGVEIYVLVDRREVLDRRGGNRGDRRSRPQITSTPPQPRLGVPPKQP